MKSFSKLAREVNYERGEGYSQLRVKQPSQYNYEEIVNNLMLDSDEKDFTPLKKQDVDNYKGTDFISDQERKFKKQRPEIFHSEGIPLKRIVMKAPVGSKNAAIISIDSSFVKTQLEEVKDTLIGKDLDNIGIASILNQAFRNYNIHFIRGHSGTSNHARQAEVYISQASIYNNFAIYIEYEDGFWTVFKNDDNWNTFVEVISSIISHELTHKQQMMRIINRTDDYKLQQIMNKGFETATKYLSIPQEIMSFANEAIVQLKQQGYEAKQIKTLLKSPLRNSAPNRAESDVFWMYTDWFNPEDKPLRLFLKYCYMYLQQENKKNASNSFKFYDSFDKLDSKKKYTSLNPLIERRDYIKGGHDMLEQNATELQDKFELPKDIEKRLRRRASKAKEIQKQILEACEPMIVDSEKYLEMLIKRELKEFEVLKKKNENKIGYWKCAEKFKEKYGDKVPYEIDTIIRQSYKESGKELKDLKFYPVTNEEFVFDKPGYNKSLVKLKEERRYVETTKLTNAIETNITDKFVKISNISVNKGNQGYQVTASLVDENNINYSFSTHSILAGGYNIQILHNRYLINLSSPQVSKRDIKRDIYENQMNEIKKRKEERLKIREQKENENKISRIISVIRDIKTLIYDDYYMRDEKNAKVIEKFHKMFYKSRFDNVPIFTKQELHDKIAKGEIQMTDFKELQDTDTMVMSFPSNLIWGNLTWEYNQKPK